MLGGRVAAEPPRFPGLQLSQPHLIDRMVFALAQDEPGAGASGQNIVAQIDHVDPLPNPLCGPGGLRIGEPAIAMEVRTRVLKRGAAQVEKALDVPLADDGLVRIEVDREIEEIGYEEARTAGRGGLASLQQALST